MNRMSFLFVVFFSAALFANDNSVSASDLSNVLTPILNNDESGIIRIGSYQGRISENNFDANMETVMKVINEQRDKGLHFLCFPETFLTGYSEKAIKESAVYANDQRILDFISSTKGNETVILVGFAEKKADGTYNSQMVVQNGRLLGIAHKTMLTQGYDDKYFTTDLELPVFEAHGVRFGVCICHTTSFVEPALYLRLKGCRLLFTPHYNSLAPYRSEPGKHTYSSAEHRSMVLNNHIGLATLLKMVVVRSNVIIVSETQLGWGDSNIWDMDGNLVAEGTPFVDMVVYAAFNRDIFNKGHELINQHQVPFKLYEKIIEAAKEFLKEKK